LAITYHAGRRIQGTQADFDGIPAISGGWKELGRTTFGGGAKTYEVASLANKRYLMVFVNNFQSGQIEGDSLRFNNDTTANQHAGRYSNDGGSDGTITNKTKTNMFGFHPHSQPSFAVMNVANLSGKEKLAIIHAAGQSSNVSGAGNAPNRSEMVAKYINTSNPISSIQQVNAWENFDSGSEMVVLGYDPDDTHTDNFWEQLASVEGDGTSTTISSGTIPARKYLWVQAFTNASSQNTGFQFNNDTGNNYTIRRSTNGGTDATETSIGYIEGSDTSKAFTNMFIINNSANEKLTIGHSIHNPTAGAGTAPTRNEVVGKWTNTSAQITEIDYMQQTTSVNFPSGSFIKVWGSN
jgi:hypothetical protein